VESIVRAAEREALVAEQAIADQRRSAEEEARRYLAAARLQVDAEAAAHAARVETLSSAARRLSEELTDAVTALRRELARDAGEALPRPPWPAQAPASQAEPRTTEPAPPAEPAPQPTWSRTEPQPPEPAAAPTNADRAGDAGETHSAAPSAESSSPVTGPARHGAEAQDEQPAATNGQSDTPVPSAARLVAIEMAVGGSARSEVEQHLRVELGVSDPQPLLDDVFGATSHAGSRLAWGEP
jgi:hypothetical protein